MSDEKEVEDRIAEVTSQGTKVVVGDVELKTPRILTILGVKY